MNKISAFLDYASEVADAMAAGKPVVALESTVIAHGLPHPVNLETAASLQRIIREFGAVPATTAIMDGRIKVGLDEAELERLATASDVRKLSTRDMAIALTGGETGATTVAATMQIAALAGIRVFATGGIGGVHRGAEQSFDESADITALARYPVAVVTAGAKSILDLPRTLERLETNGVPVLGYGCDEFPAFYLRDSGLPVNQRFDDAASIARMLDTHWALNDNRGGVIVANPIPAAFAMNREDHDRALQQALDQVAAAGVSGKDTTPALLAAMVEASQGTTLDANIALIENNARLAAELAVALTSL